MLASYITFDLSPELAKNEPAQIADIDPVIQAKAKARMAEVGVSVSETEFETLLTTVWPAMLKMKQRGALTLAQDQSSSLVYGMPRAAAAGSALTKV